MAISANNGKQVSLLEQALAQLILNQAQLVAQNTQSLPQQARLADKHAVYEKESIRLQKADERFERIEALLLLHDRMLRELPEAIRKRLGYQQK